MPSKVKRPMTKAQRAIGDALFVSLAFMAVAPPIFVILSSVAANGLGPIFSPWILIAIVFSYAIGGIPALLTGIMYALIAQYIRLTFNLKRTSSIARAALGLFCGAGISYVYFEVADNYRWFPSPLGNTALLVVIGAISGMISGLLLTKFAPLHRSTDQYETPNDA